MKELLTFKQIFARLEQIGEKETARCMRIGVERNPDYSLEFANERLAALERKIYLAQNKTERLSEIKEDPLLIKDSKHLQKKLGEREYREIRIKNKLSELFSKYEISAFLTYWNGMVNEANKNKKYFAEACKAGDFGKTYSLVKLAILARHRSRNINNWKRYRKEYHLEAEKEFRAFVIDRTHEAYMAERERKSNELHEKKRNARIAELKAKVQDYYSKKAPLFSDHLIKKRESEFSYKYGINSYKRITF